MSWIRQTARGFFNNYFQPVIRSAMNAFQNVGVNAIYDVRRFAGSVASDIFRDVKQNVVDSAARIGNNAYTDITNSVLNGSVNNIRQNLYDSVVRSAKNAYEDVKDNVVNNAVKYSIQGYNDIKDNVRSNIANAGNALLNEYNNAGTHIKSQFNEDKEKMNNAASMLLKRVNPVFQIPYESMVHKKRNGVKVAPIDDPIHYEVREFEDTNDDGYDDRYVPENVVGTAPELAPRPFTNQINSIRDLM